VRAGAYLRELWGMKLGLLVAVVVGLLAATRVFYAISIVPLKLERSSIDVASASTRVLVDTPRSALVDLRQTTYDLTSLTNRGVLVGNVMASPPVREFIAHRAGVQARRITVKPPQTPDQPRPLAGSDSEASIADLVAPPDQLRLAIEASPTSPVLDIRAEASDPAVARRLAEAAVTGTEDYLKAVANAEKTPASSRVGLIQLGRATTGVINGGAQRSVAVLAFFVGFGLTCIAVLFIARVRRGWSEEEDLERTSATGVV
jgi:hypothetical protein